MPAAQGFQLSKKLSSVRRKNARCTCKAYTDRQIPLFLYSVQCFLALESFRLEAASESCR
jgi:hypothetical protein